MAKIQEGNAIDLVTLSKLEAKIGDYKWSHLEPVEFNEEHLGEWKLCNGDSAAGTTFELMTGESNVPNAFDDGAFIRQAKSNRGKGTNESMDWKGFSMKNTRQNSHDYNHNDEYHGKSTTGFVGKTFAGAWAAPAAAIGTKWDNSEIRPNNIALNLYVKVNY